VGGRSSGRYATPAGFPLHDGSPYKEINVRRRSLEFVHRSRTSSVSPCQTLTCSIRNSLASLVGGAPPRALDARVAHAAGDARAHAAGLHCALHRVHRAQVRFELFRIVLSFPLEIVSNCFELSRIVFELFLNSTSACTRCGRRRRRRSDARRRRCAQRTWRCAAMKKCLRIATPREPLRASRPTPCGRVEIDVGGLVHRCKSCES
jgi:hypothetical protein